MNEHDIAHTFDEAPLRSLIESVLSERDFWFEMKETWINSDCITYYTKQYVKYNDRLRDLRNLLKEKFYD